MAARRAGAPTRLAELLRRKHHALADFLVALASFDAERRWIELGHNSLFSFLVRELGLSKGAAFYRNRAAELVREFPEIVEPLRDGRLCLSSVAELGNVLTRENVGEVLPRFFHLSRSEAKEVTAELRPDPAPPLRTVVIALAAPAPVVRSAQGGFPENLPDANSAVPDGAPAVVAQRRGRIEVQPLTEELRRVHLTVSRRLLEKLATARDALSHSHPGASEETILELGLDLLIERHRKRRGIGATPRSRARRPPRSRRRSPRRRRRPPRRRMPPRRRPRRRIAPATSPPTSGARCGSGTGGAARGRWRAAGSAAPRASSSSITSRDGPSGWRPRSARRACSAGSTRTSPLGGSTGTST